MKKSMKSIAVLLMALVIAFTAVPLLPTTEVNASTKQSAKASITLKTNKGKLKVGKTTTIKIKKVTGLKSTSTKASNFKFKSSNKKIATVSSSGKVTAKKVGKVKITVTSKKNSKIKAVYTLTVVKKSSSSNKKKSSNSSDSSKKKSKYKTNDCDGTEDWWGEFDDDDVVTPDNLQ